MALVKRSNSQFHDWEKGTIIYMAGGAFEPISKNGEINFQPKGLFLSAYGESLQLNQYDCCLREDVLSIVSTKKLKNLEDEGRLIAIGKISKFDKVEGKFVFDWDFKEIVDINDTVILRLLLDKIISKSGTKEKYHNAVKARMKTDAQTRLDQIKKRESEKWY